MDRTPRRTHTARRPEPPKLLRSATRPRRPLPAVHIMTPHLDPRASLLNRRRRCRRPPFLSSSHPLALCGARTHFLKNKAGDLSGQPRAEFSDRFFYLYLFI
jgi:hypothetical protein